MPAFVVALVGAAGTGKTTLAQELRRALAEDPGDHVVVDDPALPLASADLTLLMALDLPESPLSTETACARVAIDNHLRQTLIDAGCTFSIVSGHGPDRLRAALAAVQSARRAPDPELATRPRWQHVCARCGDPDCERHRLPRA